MSSAEFVRFGGQVGWLAGTMLQIWLVLAVAGLGVLVCLLPRYFQVRWIVFAPIAGLALITLLSLPLSLLGIPVARYTWPLLISLAAWSGGGALLVFRRAGARRTRRLLVAYLRHAGLWLGLGFVIVALVSAKMLTHGGNGRADGAWGSTDFGAYWIVPAYLQHHGASVAAYEAQSEYRASDLDEHVRLHARLGGMTPIAVLGHALLPGRLPALINPLIVTSLWLLVALVQAFAGRERLGRTTALLGVVCHPFLYFLLFYSYLGQAFSVLLIASGLFIAELTDRHARADPWHRGSIGAGLFFAAAILQYSSAFIIPGIFLAGTLWLRRRRGGLASVVVCGVTILLVAGYHLPRSFRELAWIRSLTVLPGWDWQRLVNVHELLGLRSLIVYEPLPSGDIVGTLVTTAITLLVGFALLTHLRRGALPRSAAAMLILTGGLVAYACVKYWQHVPNATHGLAKIVSQYALFLVLFAAAGTVAAFPRQRRRAQSLVRLTLGLFALIQFWQVVNWRRPPWFDYDLIALVERNHRGTTPLAFDPDLDDRLVAPLLKDSGRLADPAKPGPRLRFTLAAQQAKFPRGVPVDHEGAYVALREP